MGKGDVLKAGREQRFRPGQTFALAEHGDYRLPEPQTDLPIEVWQPVQTSLRSSASAASTLSKPPPEVLVLLRKRQAFQKQRNWTSADELRQQIADLGWQGLATPEGPG